MTKVQGLLFGALLLASAGFYQPVEYDNTKSRYLLLGAIVDEGRLTIDSHQEYTIDKALVNGHYYSIKPMGLAMLAAPAYWVLRKTVLGPASSLPDPTILDDPAAKYLTRVWAVSIPFAVLGLVLFNFLIGFGAEPRNALWAVLSYSFGTIALNHATIFSGHQTAAFFLMCSFVVSWSAVGVARRGAPSHAVGRLFVAGLLAGAAVLCDYLVVVYVLVIVWYVLWSKVPAREKGAFLLGGGLCAAALAIYDKACFGSFFSTGYSHLAFGPFKEYTSQGLFGIRWPDPRVTVSLLFSAARGLLFISPVLLFSLAGLAFLWRRPAARREAIVCIAVPALGLLLYSGYHGWHGGWSYGPRYLVPTLPFLAVPMALAADGGPWFQLAFLPSIAQVACAQMGCPYPAPEIRNPIVEFMLPLMGAGAKTPNLLSPAIHGSWLSGAALYLAALLIAGLALRSIPRPRPRRLPWRWRAAVAGAVACIALALTWVRTADPSVPPQYRALILGDLAQAAAR